MSRSVASPHTLACQTSEQNGSIIFERSFAKKSGISLRGKLCVFGRDRERFTDSRV